MSKSSIKADSLRRNLNNLLSNSSPSIIYQDNDSVVVNGKHIAIVDNKWIIKSISKSFNLKRCAVGYVLSIMNNDRSTANHIELLDFKAGKLKEDMFWYKHGMKSANKHSRFVLECRLSLTKDRFDNVVLDLNQKLKTVKIA